MARQYVLLIDGENFAAKSVGKLMRHIQSKGSVRVAHVYADFSRRCHHVQWRDACERNRLTPVQVFSKEKPQRVDMKMICDGVDLLHQTLQYPHTHFALATGDGDMAVLVQHIKMYGKEVVGYSSNVRATSSVLKHICDEYHIFADKTSNDVTCTNGTCRAGFFEHPRTRA